MRNDRKVLRTLIQKEVTHVCSALARATSNFPLDFYEISNPKPLLRAERAGKLS